MTVHSFVSTSVSSFSQVFGEIFFQPRSFRRLGHIRGKEKQKIVLFWHSVVPNHIQRIPCLCSRKIIALPWNFRGFFTKPISVRIGKNLVLDIWKFLIPWSTIYIVLHAYSFRYVVPTRWRNVPYDSYNAWYIVPSILMADFENCRR